MQAKIKCRIEGKLEETTVGRVLLWEIIPKSLSFDVINKVMDKKELASLIDIAYRQCTAKETVILADQLNDMGYHQATKAGISIAVGDLTIPDEKQGMLNDAQVEVKEIQQQYYDGLITNGERYNKVVDIWDRVSNAVAAAMMESIENHKVAVGETVPRSKRRAFNSIYIMADSGARGGHAQIKQLAGMRGLMAKPSGEIIETPITANFREGLSVLQYFISTHGARKGLADTALKTANSGYLTRRLVDVAQDAIVTEYDCGTLDGMEVTALVEAGDIIEPLGDRILGRVALDDVYDPHSQRVVSLGWYRI